MQHYAIGVDYGTNNVRALVVDIHTGEEIATTVFDYPSGEAGLLLDSADPNLARQNPADYLVGFDHAVAEAVRRAAESDRFSVDQVVGIGIDTTGSTPLPVDQHGVALATLDEFRDNLAAHAWLWKDHTSHAEAEEITRVAQAGNFPYLAKCGGIYSSEWYWSKILHCLRTSPDVAAAAHSWVELADFVPAQVTGNTNPDTWARGICTAGHKAMYHSQWGGLPSVAFLESLEPGLARFRYSTTPKSSAEKAGELSAAVADRVGLPPSIPVAVGALDAHMGAVGAGCSPGVLVKIIGTSSCDCLVAPASSELPDIPGLCGIVPDSIIPGMYGLEAGQSAVGDIFNWFASHLSPFDSAHASDPHVALTKQAAKLQPGESGLLALDWNNGNRTVLVDPQLSGLLIGQTLHTTAAEIYRTLVEATAFGALKIIDRFEAYHVPVQEVVTCGGIAEKNDLVLQIYADICNRPMKISRSAQTCALGAALFGAVVAGAHDSVATAQTAMTDVKQKVFVPIAANVEIYSRLYKLYELLHDGFGGVTDKVALAGVMKELIAIRSQVRNRE